MKGGKMETFGDKPMLTTFTTPPPPIKVGGLFIKIFILSD